MLHSRNPFLRRREEATIFVEKIELNQSGRCICTKATNDALPFCTGTTTKSVRDVEVIAEEDIVDLREPSSSS